MTETIHIAEIAICITRKDIRNVHLSVHPPDGRVTMAAPLATRLDVARAYAASRLGWIRRQQDQLRSQARETPRLFIERESHYVWGRRYLLTVEYRDTKPGVTMDHKHIFLTVRPGSDTAKRADVLHAWHKTLLHGAVPKLLATWEPRLGLSGTRYFLQRMKTRWGSCNHHSGHIRLNAELVKKPMRLLEYVVAHELAHLIEPTHNTRFTDLLDLHYPTWRDARAELNALPLTAEKWTRDAPTRGPRLP
jgi:predicted metal-dependent hydrolase